MATGVRGAERTARYATTAKCGGETDAHVAIEDQNATLYYPGKRSVSDVLAMPAGRFLSIGAGGSRTEAIPGPNAFILSDNRSALSAMMHCGVRPSLAYLDPPYGTGADFQSRSQMHAYQDLLVGSAYLEPLRQTLILLRESLMDDGSVYLHIGHQMIGGVKILMDEIFGIGNFRNLITRRKCSSKNYTRNSYANLNDFILFYSKSRNYKWNNPGKAAADEWIEKEYPKFDGKRRFKLVPIHAPGVRRGATGQTWRGRLPPPGKHWQYSPETLDELDRRGEIHWSRNGNPRRKVYLSDEKRIPYSDYWEDFRDAHHQSVRVTGYPTEKNLDMLRMIVEASSDPGDIVCDPYCGSGTTLEAAESSSRRWIGIDRSFAAAAATLGRLRRGVEPMGDFVGLAKSSAPAVGRPLARSFAFLVDAQVASTEPVEVRQLAAI